MSTMTKALLRWRYSTTRRIGRCSSPIPVSGSPQAEMSLGETSLEPSCRLSGRSTPMLALTILISEVFLGSYYCFEIERSGAQDEYVYITPQGMITEVSAYPK